MRMNLVFAITLLSSSARADGKEDSLLVETDLGWVQGVSVGGLNQFRSIPYAQAPIGPLRFRAPRPAQGWAAVHDGTIFGPDCRGGYDSTDGNGVEDCLTLSIAAPATNESEGGMPVIVYSFAGWNHFYPGGHPDFSPLVKPGVIVVDVQHRLNVLGTLGHPLLSIGGDMPSQGLQDQVEALRWVKRNIRAFGGDPDNVTVMSPMGSDAAMLLAYPKAKALFQKAVVNNFYPWVLKLQDAEYNGALIAQFVGCGPDVADPIGCLQAVSYDDLMNAVFSVGTVNIGYYQGYWVTQTVVDGVNVVEHPLDYVKKHGSVPLLIGSNSNNEDWNWGYGFFQQYNTDTSQQDLIGVLGSLLFTNPFLPANVWSSGSPSQLSYLQQVYPMVGQTSPTPLEATFPSVWDAVVTAATDQQAWGTRALAQNAAHHGDGDDEEHGRNAVYNYVYAHKLEESGPPNEFGLTPDKQGAGYGHDIASLLPNNFFDNQHFVYTPSADEMVLSQQMAAYWTNFARSGDPNGEGLPRWARYDAEDDPSLVLDTPITNTTKFHSRGRDVWRDQYEAMPYLSSYPYPGNGSCTGWCPTFQAWWLAQGNSYPPSPYSPSWVIPVVP